MDDIFRRIRIQLSNYQRVYRIEPNAVYVGHNEYYKMLSSNDVWMYANPTKEKITTVFGIKFYRLQLENYLAVGFIEEEVIKNEQK